ncbi:MAG: dihydroneopterin triphosphate diphosphatase [Gammaproteobacteria bacterium]
MTTTAYKRPESVLVLVHTGAGEVLLLRRRQPEDFWQEDFWQSVTGSLEADEDPAQAARRELFEETGLAASGLIDCRISNRFPILPAWRARYAPEVSHNLEHVFRIALAGRSAIRLDPAEHLEYRWLDAPSAAALVGSQTNRTAIQTLIQAAQ